MKTSSGGTVSFKKKGRIDAAFVRLETTNAVLQGLKGEFLTIPAVDLCEDDRSFLARISGIEEAEASWTAQSAIVRNELARRRVEAVKLKDDAAAKRALAQIETDAADKLEAQAASLAAKAGSLELQAHSYETNSSSFAEPDANCITNLTDIPSLTDEPALNTNATSSIQAGVARQLQEDIAKFRSQAQSKRQRATRLQQEAATLEQTARALESNSASAKPVPQ